MSDPLSPPAPPPAGEEPSLLKQMWRLLPLPWSRICQPPGLPGRDTLRHLRKLPFVLEVSHQALGAQLADHLLPRPPWLAEDKGPSTSWTRGQGCGEGSQMSCLQSAGAPGKEGRSPRGPQSVRRGLSWLPVYPAGLIKDVLTGPGDVTTAASERKQQEKVLALPLVPFIRSNSNKPASQQLPVLRAQGSPSSVARQRAEGSQESSRPGRPSTCPSLGMGPSSLCCSCRHSPLSPDVCSRPLSEQAVASGHSVTLNYGGGGGRGLNS